MKGGEQSLERGVVRRELHTEEDEGGGYRLGLRRLTGRKQK